MCNFALKTTSFALISLKAFYNGNNAIYRWHTWRRRRLNEFWWVERTKLTFVSDQANKFVLVFIRVLGSKAFKLHENDGEDEYKVPDPSRTELVLVFVLESKALKINNGSIFNCFSLLVMFMKVGSCSGVILQFLNSVHVIFSREFYFCLFKNCLCMSMSIKGNFWECVFWGESKNGFMSPK